MQSIVILFRGCRRQTKHMERYYYIMEQSKRRVLRCMRHLSKCIFEKDEIIEKVEQQEQLMVATIVKRLRVHFVKSRI